MEGESSRGRETARGAGNDGRRRSRSRSRSRSRGGTGRNSRSSSVDGRIITSNQPSHDDSDVTSLRTPSVRPAIINSIAATMDNARAQARRRETRPAIINSIAATMDNARAEARRRETRRAEMVRDIWNEIQLMSGIHDARHFRPADRTAVQQLPRVLITSGHISDDTFSTCSICHEQYQLGEAARVLPCGHMYHERCIFRWLEARHTCPLCRFQMP